MGSGLMQIKCWMDSLFDRASLIGGKHANKRSEGLSWRLELTFMNEGFTVLSMLHILHNENE